MLMVETVSHENVVDVSPAGELIILTGSDSSVSHGYHDQHLTLVIDQ